MPRGIYTINSHLKSAVIENLPPPPVVQMTAMQIAALKRLNRGCPVYILDKNGGQAKKVAKELAARGFRKAFVIAGGFDGRNGWQQSKLQVKPSSTVGWG